MVNLPIGSMYMRILGNNTQAIMALKGVEAAMASTTAKANVMSSRMALGFTAAFAVIGGLSVKAFSDFDKAMTHSTAIMTGVTGVMRKDMEQLALMLSKQGVQSAEELAGAYFYLASAGWTAGQSIQALGVVQTFATAGMFDMANATELLADAQAALGLRTGSATQDMLNMTRVSDVLTKANTLAQASTEQFALSLTHQAAATMKAYGISLEEGVAVLAAYAQQGIKAQRAGTLLARMIRLTTNAAEESRSVWNRLNIELYDATTKGFRPMADIMGDLSDHFLNMGVEDMTAELKNMGFQIRSAQAILPLLGMGDKIRDFKKALDAAGGWTKLVAAKELKSFSAQMKIVWHYIQATAIEIGRRLAPYVLKLGEGLKKASEFWGMLNEQTKDFVVKSGVIISAATLIGVALKTLGGIAIAVFGKIALAAAAPALPIIALAGLAYAIRAVWKQNLEQIANDFDNFLKEHPKLDRALEQTKSLAKTAGEGASIAWTGFVSTLKEASDMMTSGFQDPFELDTVMDDMLYKAQVIEGKVDSVVGDLTKGMSQQNKEAFEGLGDSIKMVFKNVRDQLGEDFASMKGMTAELMNSLGFTETKSSVDALDALISKYDELGKAAAVNARKLDELLLRQEQSASSIVAMSSSMSKGFEDVYDAQIILLDKQLAEYETYVTDQDRLNQWYKERQIQLWVDQQKAMGGFFKEFEEGTTLWTQFTTAASDFHNGFRAGILEAQMNMATFGELGAQVAEQIGDGLTNALWDAVTATGSLSDSMRALGLSVAETMGKWATMQLVMGGLSAFTGASAAGLGGIGGGGAAPLTPFTGYPMHHGGGIIGKDSGSGTRMVNPSVFANAQRAHNGLMPNERPIIALDDEGVFTKEQMKALGGSRNDASEGMLQKIYDKIGPTNVALFDDRKSVEEYLTSKSGSKTVVEVSRRHRREING